jgi:ankyrin repeat protein
MSHNTHNNQAIDINDLIKACSNGNYNTVDNLMNSSYIDNINEQNNRGETALTVASEKGYFDIVSRLLKDERIDINQQDGNNYSALMYACYKHHYNIMYTLLRVSDCVDVNCEYPWEETLLSRAIKHRQYDIITELLKHSNIDVNKKSLLISVCSDVKPGNDFIASLLLENKKVNVNIQDDEGLTPLMHAFYVENKFLVSKLLENNDVDVNLQDKEGRTALMHASDETNDFIISKLLENNKINVNIKDETGRTALMYASHKENKFLVSKLLENNHVDVNIQDENGMTALMYAQEEEIKKIFNSKIPSKQVQKQIDSLQNIKDKMDGHNVKAK